MKINKVTVELFLPYNQSSPQYRLMNALTYSAGNIYRTALKFT